MRLKRIGLYVLVTVLVTALIMGLALLYNENNPTYESNPYTKTESRVYVTIYGECYHNGNCSYLHSSKIAIGINEAINRGYHACSRCDGRPSGFIEVTHYRKVMVDKTDDTIMGSIIGGLIVGTIAYSFIPKEKKDK